jgi:hypothetical protein
MIQYSDEVVAAMAEAEARVRKQFGLLTEVTIPDCDDPDAPFWLGDAVISAPRVSHEKRIRKCRNCGFEREAYSTETDLSPPSCGRCS